MFTNILKSAVLMAIILAMVIPMSCSDNGTPSEQATEEADTLRDLYIQPIDHSIYDYFGADRNDENTYYINDMVINPAGTNGERFLSVSIGLGVTSSELKSRLEAKNAKIRDALITILSSKVVSQLTEAKQKEIIRYQILKRVRKVAEMSNEELTGVYFTDFVLQ